MNKYNEMSGLEFVYSDGGRSKYFSGKYARDCVCRAICNATGEDYMKIYERINEVAKSERTGKRKKKVSNARNGVYKTTYRKVLAELGWEWVPTMQIGQGCKVHLRTDELPTGTIIVAIAKHLTVVKDGQLLDTFDCSEDGQRCVYGYYRKEEKQ